MYKSIFIIQKGWQWSCQNYYEYGNEKEKIEKTGIYLTWEEPEIEKREKKCWKTFVDQTSQGG